MNFKRFILENLGAFQWLVTWFILVGMVMAGYYLMPIAMAKHSELYLSDVSSLHLTLPLAPLTLITMFGSLIIALIWQFRVVKKES